MTQQLPKTHHELAGSSAQLPTYVLSQIGCGALDTVKITKRFACVNELHIGQFEKFELEYAVSLV